MVATTCAVGASSAYAAYYAETSGLIAPILYVAMGIVLLASLLGVFVLPETQPWVDLEAKQHVFVLCARADVVHDLVSLRAADHDIGDDAGVQTAVGQSRNGRKMAVRPPCDGRETVVRRPWDGRETVPQRR